MTMNNGYFLTGNYVDPNTWKVKTIKKMVYAKSEENAIKWAKQAFYKCTINKAERKP